MSKLLSALIKLPFYALIRSYQWFVSPAFPSSCRFYPSCSQYMLDAIETHGIVLGIYYGIKRLLKCHPFGSSGIDIVPNKVKGNKWNKQKTYS